MRFTLYGDESGTMQLWTSGDISVTVTSGIFTHTLNPSGVDWRKKDIWLELRVNNRTLLPREKVMAQMYSIHSYSAENLYSNEEIKITIGTTTVYLGISGQKLYFKQSQDAQPEYLSGVPAGSVIAFAGPQSNAPQGYLLCNGDAVSRHNYPYLYAAIGTTYGGDGNSNFRLPDFRGMFLRGAGSQTAVNYPNKGGVTNTTYSAAPLGTRQGDAIRNITGDWNTTGASYAGVYSGAFSVYDSGSREGSNANNGKGLNFDAGNVVPTSTENRPVNYAVNYYIKY
jgi:microcystin-dependent protein